MKWMLLSVSFFALINVLVKVMGSIPFMELVFFRALGTAVICAVLIQAQGVSFRGGSKLLLFARGVAGTSGLCLLFYCIQNMPLASAVTLLYLSPIFTVLLAVPLLKEKTGAGQWILFLLAFLGVFMVKGFDPRISVFELLAGVGAAGFSALAYNFVRMLRNSDHELVIIFYFNVVSVLVSLPFAIRKWVTPEGVQWLGVLLLGVLSVFGQVYLTRAYHTERADKVSIVNYLGIVYALGFGYFLFAETLSWVSLLGIAIIVISVYLSARIKRNVKHRV